MLSKSDFSSSDSESSNSNNSIDLDSIDPNDLNLEVCNDTSDLNPEERNSDVRDLNP